MSRSLKVSPDQYQQVKQAFERSAFPSQTALAIELGLARGTVANFLNGKPVDRLNFQEISEKLRLDWQEIAAQVEPLPPSPSPFLTGSPILEPRCFFGRERELKRIFGLLNRHPLQNAAIVGKRRSGKTSLLRYLQKISMTPTGQLRPGQKSDWLPNPETYRWIFVDLQDPRRQSRERLLGYILECLKLEVPDPCDLEHFMDSVSDNLRYPTVILLDEIGVALERCPELDDEFWESLRSLGSNYTRGKLAFVLATKEFPMDLARSTGHSSSFFNIFAYTAHLGPLTSLEARELIASSPLPFAESDIEWILAQSQCWPLLVQMLCRDRLFSLENGETGDDWREEALGQIRHFADRF